MVRQTLFLDNNIQNHHAERDEYVSITLRVILGTLILELDIPLVSTFRCAVA